LSIVSDKVYRAVFGIVGIKPCHKMYADFIISKTGKICRGGGGLICKFFLHFYFSLI
jgi:hypothetical protein